MHYLVLLAILALLLNPQPSAAGAGAALIVDKTALPSGVIPGNLITFPITAMTDPNFGNVLNLTISDPLPSATRFISAVASPGATLTTPAVNANGTVTSVWDAAGGTPGGLTPPGTTRSLTIVARVCPEAGCTDLVNTATGTATSGATTGMDTATNALSPAADLGITKEGPTGRILAGASFTYVLTVANAGPSTSPTTQVVDTLPPGFIATNVTSTIAGANCVIGTGGQTVTCDFALGAANQCAAMPIAASGTISIDVMVAVGTGSGVYTNNAAIGIAGPCGSDPNPDNNTAGADVEVIGGAPVPVLSSVGFMVALALLIGIGGLSMWRVRRVF